MPGFEHGYSRGVSMVVEAFVIAVILGEVVPELVAAGLLPKNLFSGFVILSILGIVVTIDNSRYWSFGYLAGFSIGMFIILPVLLQTEFLTLLDLFLYGGTAVATLALRLKIHL